MINDNAAVSPQSRKSANLIISFRKYLTNTKYQKRLSTIFCEILIF